MKKTLESFIDPVNIPQRYGGQLDFKFGDMPVLDPHLQEVIKWEGDRTDFPHGPMYWIHKKDSPEMEALAVGTIEEKERKEGICTVEKRLKDDEDRELRNGHATAGTASRPTTAGTTSKPKPSLPPHLLEAETAPPSAATSNADINPFDAPPPEYATKTDPSPVVQNGEIVHPSRPEPKSFVTAEEGINTLFLNEKPGNLANGAAKGPHRTEIANKLDPAVNVDGSSELESAHVHSEVQGGAAEEADSAHGEKVEQDGEQKRLSMVGKIKEKVGL